jgi:hypothetical protein
MSRQASPGRSVVRRRQRAGTVSSHCLSCRCSDGHGRIAAERSFDEPNVGAPGLHPGGSEFPLIMKS